MAITLDGTNGINSSGVIVAPDGSASAPAITNDGDTNTGIFFPAADNIGFATNGVIRGRWTTDGLCFGSDTAAANALDDYEEGTWTPAWSVSGGTITANSNTSGKYVKIGRVVYIWGYISYQSHTGSPTGALSVTGLPFAAGQIYGQQNYGGFFTHWTSLWTANPPTTGNIVTGGLSTITLGRPGTNGYVAVNFADMNTSSANHSQAGFFGQYQTA
jgi:hypothetical protein